MNIRLLCLSLVCLTPLLACAENAARDRAGMTPHEVVRLQVEALQVNDQADSGIALVWEYTSPRNRAATGPFERFAAMIHDGYADMLNSRSWEVGEASLLEDGASVPVRLICQAGNPHGYIFWLSREHPDEANGFWRTEGVSEVPIADTEGAPGTPDSAPRSARGAV